MAGLVTHLITAREVIKLLPAGTIKDEGLFYAGSIAPDAVHSRENFVRADKKHTHLRDDILDRDFMKDYYMSLFCQRVVDFILENKTRRDGLFDAYRGYVVHLLTDELNILTMRQESVLMMEKEGISQGDIEFFHNVVEDMNRNDIYLAHNYAEMNEIGLSLERVKPFQIEGMVSEFEITDTKEWVLQRYFRETHEVIEPIYISFDRTLDFISMSAANIARRLCRGGDLPRMF
ncbi:MAG TPA: zinc dependent phospholipase C family protein [Mobilitalea sp.]|nr:zinc dependent phospholipase C family protein [Mobilitalea sp.]